MSRFRSPAARVRTSIAGVVAAAVATGGMATVPAAAATPAAASAATTAAATSAAPAPAAAALAPPTYDVLVFSKTTGFRHDSIGAGIRAIERLGAQYGFTVDATEDATQFTAANLEQYEAVVWLSTTSDVLNDAQQAAFEDYVQAGGGYVGVHAASDTEYTWPWYGELVGAYFQSHPAGTPTATIDVEDKTTPSSCALPDRWERTDEWYNFQSKDNPVVNGGGADYSPRGQPQHQRHRDARRVDLRRERRQRHRRRPPDRLVPGVRRRPQLLHRRRPHRRVVLRAALPAPPARRHPVRRGRGPRRLHPAGAHRRLLRAGHPRQGCRQGRRADEHLGPSRRSRAAQRPRRPHLPHRPRGHHHAALRRPDLLPRRGRPAEPDGQPDLRGGRVGLPLLRPAAEHTLR